MTTLHTAKLREYARILIEIGLNLQPGQTVRITAPVECAPLARLCAQEALDRGARDVLIDWTDDFVTRQRYLKSAEAVFSEFPDYLKRKFDWMLESGCTSLSILGSDPNLLNGVEPSRILAWQRAMGLPSKPWYDAMSSDQFQWTVCACPTEGWARRVFPDLPPDQALDALWDAVFSICRITGDGSSSDQWEKQTAAAARRCDVMNRLSFRSLRYRNSLGTDLTVFLPEHHVWMGGREKTPEGTEFLANLPTEEIFTAPCRDGVSGTVCSSLPLSLNGSVVRNFQMEFCRGQIISVRAEEGESFLKNAISVDEGSSRLGEVALVPCDSPVSRTGILFYNTLFDENASCHLAFGSSYPSCVRGAEHLDERGQEALGLNHSMTHVDFMIGTPDLSITGTTWEGEEIPVFRNGNFVF